MGWIYIVFNLINHKAYIGKWSKKRIEKRRNDYKNMNSHNEHLNRAVRKYGWENFIFDTLHENVPHEMLSCLERQEIARFDCNKSAGGWGYNCTDGGDGILGHKHTQETRQAMRESNRKRAKDGTHPFLGGEIQRETNRKRLDDGTHHFLGGEIARENARKRIADGTHHFLGGEISRKTQRKRIADGTHHFLGQPHNRKPDYERMRWDYHITLSHLPIAQRRKKLYGMYPETNQRTIRWRVRCWQQSDTA